MSVKNKNHWEDENFINELNHEYTLWKKGNVKAYTLAEVDLSIEQLKRNLNKHHNSYSKKTRNTSTEKNRKQ